jgi:glycosyltransferase involved in cell wall biosynthesis
MTRISVAMTTFNGERFIREQLDSLAAQTKPPFELVITDDGSTDCTPEIIAEFF